MELQHTSGQPVPGTPLHRVILALNATAAGDDVEVFVGDIKDVANACGANAAESVALVRDLVKGKSVGTAVTVAVDNIVALIAGATSPQPKPPAPEEQTGEPGEPKARKSRAKKPEPQGEQSGDPPSGQADAS